MSKLLLLWLKHHLANSSPDQNCDKVNMTVEIPNDIWLEAIKFFTCPQWSQKRFVSGQINGIVERNISRLPKMVIACADMYYNSEDRAQELEKRRLNTYSGTVIAFDTNMPENQSTQWFEKRGFTLNAPVNIPADDLLIVANKWTSAWKSNLNMCIHGFEQETISYSDEVHFPSQKILEKKRFPPLRKPVLFYAQLNPVSNRYSWTYLAQFLKFIYHPTSYIKEVKMFGVNQAFIDSIKCNIGSIDNEPRYIRCESFSLKGLEFTCDMPKINFNFLLKRLFELVNVYYPNLLTWLTRNVRTETLTISLKFESFDPLVKFLLDPSEATECASSKVKIDVSDPVDFLNVLIKEFRAIPLVEDAMPTIEFLCPCRDVELEDFGPNLIDKEVDSMGAYAWYMIPNGQNQMRIYFCKSNVPNRCDCKIRIYSI